MVATSRTPNRAEKLGRNTQRGVRYAGFPPTLPTMTRTVLSSWLLAAKPRTKSSRLGRTGAWFLLCWGSLAGGCSEEDTWVETRYARITGTYGVCAGLAAYVDERIELTAEWVQVEPQDRIDIFFGEPYVAQHQEDYEQHIGGVTYRGAGRTRVFTTAGSLGHELVHAVRYSEDLVLPTLIDEGVAQLYDGGEFNFNGGGISYAIPDGATLPRDPHTAYVGESATFVGWLHEELPRDDFLELINDPSLHRAHGAASNWTVIEEATGMSKEVLETRWSSEARHHYSEVPRCRPERTHQLRSGDALRIQDHISCAESSTTFGPYVATDDVVYTAQRWHCFPLDEPTSVRVSASGPDGTQLILSSVPGSCISTLPLTEASEAKWVAFGTTDDFLLGDCSWVALIRSAPDVIGNVELIIEVLD